MRVLLDTHTFLWWVTDNNKLSALAHKIISNGNNEIFLSAVSGWEIAIKSKLGRIKLPEKIDKFILNQIHINSMQILNIEMVHSLHIYNLPNYHNDPFDRMLIAQSQIENLPLLTVDSKIAKYEVKVLW